MNTNEKIAIWLGLVRHLATTLENYWWRGDDLIQLDFLHDRNQQKWIEDKLIEEGYELYYEHIKIKWMVEILKDKDIFYQTISESKDLAFISAVEQLIDKEETK